MSDFNFYVECMKMEQSRKDTPDRSARYRDLLRQIAYPRRGTDEERMDINDAAALIRANFSLEDLQD